MRHAAAVCAATGLGVMTLAGCSVNRAAHAPCDEQSVLMGMVKPADSGYGGAALVAHDALGGLIFGDYVAFVRLQRMEAEDRAVAAVPAAAE